jgi:hypothetical protein
MKHYFLLIPLPFLFAACSSGDTTYKNPERKKMTDAPFQLVSAERAGVASVLKLPGQFAAYEEVSI